MQSARQTADKSEEIALDKGMVPSPFIDKLRATFVSAAGLAKLWTPEFAALNAPNRKALIGADIASAFRSLFLRNETHGASIPESGAPASATKLMKEFLEGDAKLWPDDILTFTVPKGFKPETFRRYEVGCAVPIMMEAFHRRNPGGEPTDFPPSKPH